MELADDGTNDVPDVRALVMEMMTNLFISTYNHQVYCTKYVNIVVSFEVFQFIYLPCSLISGWRGPLLQWFLCRTPWKRPRWRFGDIKTKRVSHDTNIKTKKVKLPDIIQTKDGRHYRNSQTKRTRESEYLIDLISSDHSEYGIDGCWPGICSLIIQLQFTWGMLFIATVI